MNYVYPAMNTICEEKSINFSKVLQAPVRELK